MESPIKGGGTKSDAMDDGTTSGSSGIVTYTSPPALVTPNNSAYARLHVCQASYGDCLALEIDPTPPNNYPTFPPVGWSGNPWSYGDGELQFGISPAEALKGQRQSKSRRVILIDGGPGNFKIKDRRIATASPLHSLYHTLNTLLPPSGNNRIDTLCVTHDDADHMYGIHQFLVSLEDAGATKPKNTRESEFSWIKGTALVKGKQAPFANIWHNSSGNLIKNYIKRPRQPASDKEWGPWDGYFDRGRQALVDKGCPMPDFNQEFGATLISKEPRQASPTTFRAHVKFDFIGPKVAPIKALAKKYDQKVPTAEMAGVDPFDSPYTTEKLSTSDLHEIQAMMATDLEKIKKDGSKKNQSSLAFITTVSVPGKRSYTALFTGDANATDTFLPLYTQAGGPIEVDVMKVMHHGSAYNNYLNGKNLKSTSKITVPDQLQKALPNKLKRKGVTKESLEAKVIHFFNNIRARKYIISAAGQGHANPHISTLGGILTRAVMFPAPGGIDIYFTNRIYAPTWKRLSEFWLSIDPKGININPPSLSPISDKGTDLSHLKPKQVSDMDYDAMGAYWRIWVLKPDAKFGTVLLDQDASRMEDREVWQRYLPHQSTLEEFMKTTYYSDAIPTIKILEVKYTWEAKIVKWKEEDLENERIKRRKKEEPPPPKSMDVPPAAPLSVVPPNPGKAEAVMVDNLMADAPLTSQIVPKHTEPQVPPLRIPWATLVKFGLAVGDIDLFPVALVPILKTLRSVDDLLAYFVISHAMTAADEAEFKRKGLVSGQYTMGALISLLLRNDSVELFLKSLPLEFLTSLTPLNERLQNHLLWQISDFFQAVVVDFQAVGSSLGQRAGIAQVFFSLSMPTDNKIQWTVPGKPGYLGSSPMVIQLDGQIDITIYWPGDPKSQIVYGRFRGFLPNHGNRKILGEYMILPSEELSIRYYFEFADETYNSDGYTISLIDLIQIFGSFGANIVASLVSNFPLPGLSNLSTVMKDTLVLSRPGFLLQRDSKYSADIFLQKIFGTFTLQDAGTWSPFGDIVTFRFPKIKFTIDNFVYPSRRRLLVHIYETLDFQGRLIPIEFESRIEPSGSMVYRLSFVPDASQPFSIITLMDWLQVSDYKAALPDFLSNTFESISLQSFTLGWFGSSGGASTQASFSPVPAIVEVVANMSAMVIIPEILEINKLQLNFRIDNPRDATLRTIFIDARGAIELADSTIDAHLTIGQNPFMKAVDPTAIGGGGLTLQLDCQESPVTLGNILFHFLSDVEVLPNSLETIVENLGMDKLLLNIEKSNTGTRKWELSFLVIELSLADVEFDLFDGVDIESPNMIIRANYPFNKTLRQIQVSIDCFVEIADYGINCSLLVSAGANAGFALSIQPAAAELPVFAVLKHFGDALGSKLDFTMPDEFGVLSTTNLDSAYISFSKNERGKFGPSDVAFVVSSELDLMIWDAPSVRIDELSLSYSYSRGAGSDVIFHSILNIGEAALDTNITYNGPGASSALNMATTNPSTPATTQMANRAGSWAITSTYDGTISFFNIIKRLSGLDLQEKLSGNDLTVIRKVLDVNISKLTLSLTKQQDAASIFLQARTDWLVFESLAIAASKDTLGWGFSLGLACQDNLLALLPSDFAQNLSDYVKVNDTVVAIFLGELDPVVFPPLATLVPRPQWAGNGIGGGVAVATTVKIDNTTKLKVIGMLLSKADIQVVGVIKNDLFSLSVRVKSFSLLQNKLQIAGDFVVLSDTQTKLFIGIRGTFSFDLGPEITQDRIAGAIDFGLDISNPALIGLSFKVAVLGPLRDLFRVKGLQVSNFVVTATFPPAQEFIPSMLGISGAIQIASLNNVSGSIDLLFVENNPQNCYATGSIKNLDIPKIVSAFAKDAQVPSEVIEAIEGNGINLKTLQLEIVPHNMMSISGVAKKQKMFFEGNMSLGIGGTDVWAGYALIDVEITKFKVLGMLSPLTIGTTKLFSITRNPSMIWGWDKYTGGNSQPKPTVKDVDPKLVNDGPILQISSENSQSPIFISGQVTFLGQTRAIIISVTNKGIEFGLGGAGFGYNLSGRALINYSSGLTSDVSMTVNPTEPIELAAMNFPHRFGGITLPTKTIAASSLLASITTSYGIAWNSRSGTFWMRLGGTMKALNRTWNILTTTLSNTITATDLESVEKIGKRFIEEFKAQFRQLLTNFLNSIRNDMNAIINFIREQWPQFSLTDLTRAIGCVLGIDDWRPIANAVIKLLTPGMDGAIRILRELGLRADSVGAMARECFNIPLKHAQQITRKLKQFGYEAEESMATLKNVFAYSDVKITMSEMLDAGFDRKEIMAAAKLVFDASKSVLNSWAKSIGMVGREIEDFFRGIF